MSDAILSDCLSVAIHEKSEKKLRYSASTTILPTFIFDVVQHDKIEGSLTL